MTLTLTERVVSKKNSKQVFRNRYTGKTIVSTSDAYKNWHTLAGYQIKRFRPATPLSGPLSISIRFNLKGKLDSDLDNMMASIIDLLQDLEFIENDKQIVEAHLLKSAGHPDFSTLITIEKAPPNGEAATTSD